ncbi:peroxiredoxin [Piscinibacter sakaiensis]|nr:peroxiredoxin [Piscinibacter sakaiensis]
MPAALIRALATVACAVALPAAQAALKPGDAAPAFTAEAALGGKAFRFDLAEALKRGPVVLYFYPKAFTSGCTYEAHQFAEATERFAALGATVVGVSSDDIDTLKRFSREACRDKFAVAADEGSKVIKAYDARLASFVGMADRISYVIGRDGRIAFVHEDGNPDTHVANTLKAVERLARR